jgi:hypothetical protein
VNLNGFVQDTINPILLSYNLDLDASLLMMQFFGNSKLQSMNVSYISLQSAEEVTSAEKFGGAMR